MSALFSELIEYFREWERKKLSGQAADPDELIQHLLQRRFHCWTLPASRSSSPLSCMEYMEMISGLSGYCPSAVLSMAMHLYTVWGLSLGANQTKVKNYLDQVEGQDILFASPNEPGLYLMAPGQMRDEDYRIHAVPCEGGYRVSGIKKFVSLEPYLRYLPTYCKVQGYQGSYHGIIMLLLDKQAPGVSVDSDWNVVSMAATSSNGVRFDDVFVPQEAVVFEVDRVPADTELLGYLFRLTVASVYYGIACRAVSYIEGKCKTRRIPHYTKPLSFFPGVQYTLAEMLILLETSRSQLERLCRTLDLYLKGSRTAGSQKELKRISLITKDYVVKAAEETVNKAMKIEGIESISERSPLSVLYQEVKAGMFHPPQRDVTYEIIAKDQFGIIPLRNRW
ncbi:hypothetical protein DNH61_06330 [Paenibacillus sambharensis]|uniref:Acyl-CoA dehydrogenase/oxidase C-terminal domain-containing protein n=1 Tax=Paenibacillus sambharensis TaxID=1803190 RepID=A0A2W1LYQ9_9BACL|nr:acyl-CoA dehydrogenase family protein [Paenibacillus sambharensis]PZD96811.1 hypothetical protein DNH61_06330 [Paenibacillus sambharensis]